MIQNARFLFNEGQPKVVASGGHALPLRALGFWDGGPYSINDALNGMMTLQGKLAGKMATTIIVANDSISPWICWSELWYQKPATEGGQGSLGFTISAKTEKMSVGSKLAMVARAFYNGGDGFSHKVSTEGEIKSEWQLAAAGPWDPTADGISVGLWSWGNDFTVPAIIRMKEGKIVVKMIFPEAPEFPEKDGEAVRKVINLGDAQVSVCVSSDDCAEGDELLRMDVSVEGAKLFARPPRAKEGHGTLLSKRMSCWCRRQDLGNHYFDLVSTGKLRNPARDAVLASVASKLLLSEWAVSTPDDETAVE